MNLIKKVFLGILSLLIMLSGTRYAFAQEVVAPETINSYDLFWPIVAGKVMGDPMYSLKMLKEKIRQKFIFSDYRKADYNITLSVKRTVEVEKLFLEKKDYSNAKKTLDAASEKREKARELIMAQKEKGVTIIDLDNTLGSSLEKQSALLRYVETKVPDEQRSVIEESIRKIETLSDSLK